MSLDAPHALATPQQLKERRRVLREQRAVLRDQISLAQTLQHRHLVESWFALGDSDGYWSGADALDRSLWDPNLTGLPLIPPTTPADRRHGQNWPLWRTEVDLAFLRQRARVQVETNHFAKSVVNNVTNYVIGIGYSYKAIAKDRLPSQEPRVKSQEPALDSSPSSLDSDDLDDVRVELEKLRQQVLLARFQAWLDAWLRRNRWNDVADAQGETANGVIAESRERESCRRVIRDGELFFWLWLHPDGNSDVRWIEPEQIQQPPAGESYEDGWSFGKQHRMDPVEDVESIEAYHVIHQDASTAGGYAEVIDADFVVHVLVPGTDSSLARGTPMLSYGTADAFDRALKLEKNASIGAAIRAATAEIWAHDYGTQGQIQSMADTLAARQTTDPLTGKQVDYERMHPGAIRRLPKGITPINPAPDQSASFLTAVQADLRAAGCPFSAPEYWTGSTDNGNYSNLETASAPTVQMGKAWQTHFKTAFLRVLWKAIRHAVRCGQLPREVLSECDLQVEPPTVLHRNELEITQQRQIESQNKVLSPQTWCAETGRDWDTEAGNWQEYDEEFGGQGQPLGLPGGPGDDQPPQPGLAGGDAAPAGFESRRERRERKSNQLLEALIREGGFTGTVTDKLGRKVQYANGKRVKRAAKPGAARPAGAKPASAAAKVPASKMQQQAQAIVAGRITPTKERAFEGQPVPTKQKLSKQLAGAIGEEIFIQHLKRGGFTDAGYLSDHLNSDRNNLPADLLTDHRLVEVKAGQVSNGAGAQQWRLTLGEPGVKEKAALASMSAEDKAQWNARKQQEIHARKEAALREVSKELGFAVGIQTATLILNPDTRTADLYVFDGVHDRIGWNSEQAKKAYVGSVRYG